MMQELQQMISEKCDINQEKSLRLDIFFVKLISVLSFFFNTTIAVEDFLKIFLLNREISTVATCCW